MKTEKLRKKSAVLYLLMTTLPLEFTPSASDSSETNLKIIGALGKYALISRDCAGDVIGKEKKTFEEISAQIDHKFASPARIGIRASRLSYEQQVFTATGSEIVNHTLVLNPFMNLERRHVALGVGYFWTQHPLPELESSGFTSTPSFYFRYRRFSVSYLHAIPYLINGYGQAGFRGESESLRWWVGANAGPYDHLGLLTKIDFFLSPNVQMNVAARIGESAGLFEGGFHFGLSYQF